nr:O-antigen ligase family protein [Heliobacterium chlorum]
MNTIQTLNRIIVNSLVVRAGLWLYQLVLRLEPLWLYSRFYEVMDRGITLAGKSAFGQFFGADPLVRHERQLRSSWMIGLWRKVTGPVQSLRLTLIDRLHRIAKGSFIGDILAHMAVPEGWQLGGLAKAGLAFLPGFILSYSLFKGTNQIVALSLLVLSALFNWRRSETTVTEIWYDSWLGKAVTSLIPEDIAPRNRENIIAPALTGGSAIGMYTALFGFGVLLPFLWTKTGNPLVLALPVALFGLQLILLRPSSALWIVTAYTAVDWLLRLKTASLANWWDEMLFALMVAAIAAHWLTRRDFRWRLHPSCFTVTTFISVMLFLFLIDHSYPNISIPIDGLRVVIQHILWFYVAAQLVRSPKQASLLLIFFTLIGTAIAAYGVYQYVTGAPMPAGWVDQAEDIKTRAFSIVGSPNILGSFLVLTTPIALSLAYRGTAWQRLFYLACAGIMGLGMIFSFSRGAWLGLAIAIILFSLLQDRRLIALMIIGGILLPIASPSVSDRISYLLSPEYFKKSATDGRLERWDLALDQWKAHPVTGAGFGRFGGAAAERHKDELPHRTLYTDNYYMKTAAETGTVGLIAFITLMIAAIRTAIGSALHTPRNYRALATGVACGLVGVALHNAVENVFEVPLMVVSFWICVALVWALRRQQPIS